MKSTTNVLTVDIKKPVTFPVIMNNTARNDSKPFSILFYNPREGIVIYSESCNAGLEVGSPYFKGYDDFEINGWKKAPSSQVFNISN